MDGEPVAFVSLFLSALKHCIQPPHTLCISHAHTRTEAVGQGLIRRGACFLMGDPRLPVPQKKKQQHTATQICVILETYQMPYMGSVVCLCVHVYNRMLAHRLCAAVRKTLCAMRNFCVTDHLNKTKPNTGPMGHFVDTSTRKTFP